MQTCYLVDFENVTFGGLEGIDSLPAGDTVYLLFTNNPRVPLDRLANSMAALHLISVPAGSQSLDMHLISLAGYLAGVLPEDGRIVIVSRDTDYANPAAFWNKRLGSQRIIQQEAIVPGRQAENAPRQEEPALPEVQAPAPAPQAPAPAAAQSARASRNRGRRQRRQRVVQQTMNDVPTVTFPQPEPEPEEVTPPAPVQEPSPAVPEELPLLAQADTEAAVPEASQEAPSAGEMRDQRNRRVMKALAEGGVSSQQCGAVASAIARLSKLPDMKNLKLSVYHELVKLYGRKQGKSLYDMVKPVIDDPSEA